MSWSRDKLVHLLLLKYFFFTFLEGWALHKIKITLKYYN